MIVNEQGEWESESEPKEEAPIYDEEIIQDKGDEIQPDEEIIIVLFLFMCLVLLLKKKRMASGTIFSIPEA